VIRRCEKKMSDLKCKICKQALVVPTNWAEYDHDRGNRWCKKCKAQYMRDYKKKNQTPLDRGIKKVRGILRTHSSRGIPNVDKVEEFMGYVADPRNLNRKGFPRISKIFHRNGITSPEKGFTIAEMAKSLYPEECDDHGIPSRESKDSIRAYIKRVTEKYQGNLEIYATPCIIERRREWRWHITVNMRHTREQTSAMMRISRGIELNAKRREKNQMKTQTERMRKVDLLDEFFSTEGEE
jgi:hypothetical protein